MIKRIEKSLFYLLVFTLPFQTREFVYNFADVGKIGNEFTSTFLYFTDILILFIFIIVFWRWVKHNRRFFKKVQTMDYVLVSFFAFCILSLIKANFLGLGFYKLIKLAEFMFLFFYIKSTLSRYNFKRLLEVIVASGILQAVIAIAQYAKQQDLGFKILGESPLGPGIAGVAKFVVGSQKVIRAYGTFPHPNILASFLLMALFSLLVLHLSKMRSKMRKTSVFLLVTGYGLLVTALFFTFSRIVIFFGALTVLAFLIWSYKNLPQARRKVIKVSICLFLISCFLFLVFLPQVKARFSLIPEDQAIALRKQYNRTAFLLIRENPLLGAGIGQYVAAIRDYPWPQWQLQPVHNTYLLIASEVGILALGAFLLFLFFVLKEVFTAKIGLIKSAFLALFFTLVFIMLFDHFPWTLQQGSLIFWITLGILGNLEVC